MYQFQQVKAKAVHEQVDLMRIPVVLWLANALRI